MSIEDKLEKIFTFLKQFEEELEEINKKLDMVNKKL